jgi:cytochrome c oxidase assembly protein subunit 11
MPVVFVIDPALPKDIKNITLSYTFFEVNGTQKVVPGQHNSKASKI